MFFRKPAASPKHADLYVDRVGPRAIVVAKHYNGPGGVLIEDDAPVVLDDLSDAATLTSALRAALERSSVKAEVNLRDRKMTDWPAFRASGLSSARKFATEFIVLSVRGANERNVTYEIEGSTEPNAELRVTSSVAALSPELGERSLAVWRACRDRRI